VCHAEERSLAEVLAGRVTGAPAGAGGGDDNVAEAAVTSPELGFMAAVASAAVRVAVEAWAAGDAPAHGPRGPAALAMRNLGALRDFPWGEIEGAVRAR